MPESRPARPVPAPHVVRRLDLGLDFGLDLWVGLWVGFSVRFRVGVLGGVRD